MSEPTATDLPALVVLVAEDDILIRMVAVDVLTDAGFMVIEAGHADEALIVLNARGHEIQALFTDVHMPGTMTGLELARHVRDHWPWISLLVASGRARPASVELPAKSRFLPKPYDPIFVVQHIRDLVAES